MRLVNYGVGEICDRLSILALKILHADGDASHFVNETNALLAQLRTRDKSGKWFQYYAELAAVNAIIWQGEDELRTYRMRGSVGGETTPVVVIAFRLQAMNDHRAELIKQINVEAGDHIGDEKVSK